MAKPGEFALGSEYPDLDLDNLVAPLYDPYEVQPRRRWAQNLGGVIGPVGLDLFVIAPTASAAPDNVEIGPVVLELVVIDGSQVTQAPPILVGGGPPPPAFSVTSDVVMELTFLPFRPRYAVEITDVTEGLVDP